MHNDDYYGDKFKWFVGIVKERSEDSMVRVRVFGIHRMDDVTDVSDGDLPWAVVLIPATAGDASAGNMSISLDTGDWVVGFFADGDNCQQPVVIGVLGGNLYSQTGVGGDDSVDGYNDTGDGGDGGGDGGGGEPGDVNVDQISLGTEDNLLPGRTVKDKIYIALRSRWEQRLQGDSRKAHLLTSAFMGAMQQESSFDPYVDTNVSEGAYGLIQWTRGSGRRGTLFHRYRYPPPPRTGRVGFRGPNISQQIDFIFYELDNGYSHVAPKMYNVRSLDDAIRAVNSYVVPGVFGGRGRFAADIESEYRNFEYRPD